MKEEILHLNLALSGKEIEIFAEAKEKSGIRSNTEFIRFLIKSFVKA